MSPRQRPPPARSKIAARHQAQCFRQLAMLLSSGFLVPEALGRLKDSYPDSKAREILREIHLRVAGARTSFSRALAQFPRSFPPGVVAMVEAGEEAGAMRLAERLADLAERVAYAEAYRRQIRRACAYPAFALAMTAGLCVLMLGVVFPRLAAVLDSLGGSLPALTRAVIAVSGAVGRGWPYAVGAAAVASAAVAALRRFEAPALALDGLLLRLPLLGKICRDLTASLFCKVYRQLYQANKPAPDIVELCSQLTGNAAIRRRLAEARRKILSGSATVAEALSQSGLFPPLACLSLEIGEQSGQLAAAMDRTAAFLNESARERIAAAISVINPALTLGVVAGAGLVILSFFEAVYQVAYATH